MFDQSIQHFCSLHLCFEEGHNRPHPISKYLPDLFHMFILHLNPVEDELHGIFSDLILLNHPIDHNTPYGNPKFMEPIDESRDDSNGKAFRQGDKKEGCEGIIGQELFNMSHPILKT